MELDGRGRAVELTPADAEAVTELVRACGLGDGGDELVARTHRYLHLERPLR